MDLEEEKYGSPGLKKSVRKNTMGGDNNWFAKMSASIGANDGKD